jgi:CubicO group peptidase (beta-lactamase class C family)
MKIALKILLLVVALTAATLIWQFIRVAPMATGYIAKTICSEHFVAGRDDIEHIWADIRDLNPVFGLGNFDLDTTAARASGYFGPGLAKTTAVYREGLGCTIAVGVEPGSLEPLPASAPDRTGRPLLLLAADVRNPALEAVLDEAFSEPSAESHRQTRAVVVLKGGRIIAERYAPPFTRETPLIGWSMTKSVVNTLIGILVRDGLLELDAAAPVPEWRDSDDPRSRITLRHLLQMSSGLDFEEVYEPGSDATNMLFTEFSAAGYAAASTLKYEPGTHWYYSSGTSNILARVIRDTVGGSTADVREFTQRRLFDPIGIRTMVLEPDASGAPVGSSFSYATARDWARLGQFWLQGGMWQGERLLPEGWMEWSATPAPAAPMGEYGAQFWLNAGIEGRHRAFPDVPESMFFANGFNNQIVAVFPEQELVVVRLGFTTDGSWNDNAFLSAVLETL